MDLTLFKEKSYDYARSISSVRYGLSSALYSLVLGSIAAAGQYLVLRSASSPYGQTLTIAGWAVVGGVAALLFYALYRRRLDSSAEYDARLNLIVLSSLELARIEEGEPEVSELQVNITELAAAAENPVAVFDLDNTLLIGDVQEALLARLSRAGRLRGFRWSEYVGMLETDHQRALRMAVEALDGHTLSSIEQETRALLVENESKLVVQGCEILMPKPHPVLQRLVAQLQMSGIECLVISASNQISVEVLSWELFGIPKRNVVGIRSTIGHRLLTDLPPASEQSFAANFLNSRRLWDGSGDRRLSTGYLCGSETPNALRISVWRASGIGSRVTLVCSSTRYSNRHSRPNAASASGKVIACGSSSVVPNAACIRRSNSRLSFNASMLHNTCPRVRLSLRTKIGRTSSKPVFSCRKSRSTRCRLT